MSGYIFDYRNWAVVTCYWHQVGRGFGCYQTSHSAQDDPPPTENYLTQYAAIYIKKPEIHLLDPFRTVECIVTHIMFPLNFILLID